MPRCILEFYTRKKMFSSTKSSQRQTQIRKRDRKKVIPGIHLKTFRFFLHCFHFPFFLSSFCHPFIPFSTLHLFFISEDKTQEYIFWPLPRNLTKIQKKGKNLEARLGEKDKRGGKREEEGDKLKKGEKILTFFPV